MIENNMILTDEMKRRIKEEYERLQKERAEREANPLSQYSTTELKKRTQEEKNFSTPKKNCRTREEM